MTPHRVLVIDDDPYIRESLTDVLEDAGYEVIPAVHGKDALDRLTAAGETPCVILLDLMMPVMDGETFREEQMRRPELSGVPVIVLSAYDDVAQRAAALHVEHIAKPVRVAELLRRLRAYCTPLAT